MSETRPIYLDNNASTCIAPEAFEVMVPWLTREWGNPSSAHVYGARARAAVERAREEVAALLGARADEIVFTSGGTEASNLAIGGVLAAAGAARRHVVTTCIEHPATAAPCRAFEATGGRVTWLGVGAGGRVDAAAGAAALCDDTALVTLMHANNETGVLQPVAAIAAAAAARGVPVHVDAAQSAGKVPVRVDELGADLVSVAGHKLYAPKGVGALYVRRGVRMEPVMRGAGHEGGRRPGTENVAGIVAFGRACALARAQIAHDAERVRGLRERLHERLRAGVPGLALSGDVVERLPNTLNVRFPGASGRRVLEAAPEVAASTGSACHDGHETPSAVLLAMGLAPQEALGAVRLTLGRYTTEDEVDRAAAALVRAWREVRAG